MERAGRAEKEADPKGVQKMCSAIRDCGWRMNADFGFPLQPPTALRHKLVYEQLSEEWKFGQKSILFS